MHARKLLPGLITLAASVFAEDFVLNLPWGKWQATTLPADPKILVFSNVRFGAQPERFSRSYSPDWMDDSFQHSEHNISCYQIDPFKTPTPPEGPGSILDPTEELYQTEDCLFLDLYVPKDALVQQKKLPVTVWIYGGGYAFGSKTQGGPMYSGQSIIRASEYNTIFVTGNYRVGAFGWLSGNYMEQVGQPNAGLYDQALLFEWVQQYIEQVGGDRDKVSAWGESAGAGSILHHLTRGDGKVNPNFRSFVAQSPGYQWAWDNCPGGKLDTLYRNFSRLAGCGYEFDIDCLRQQDIKILAQADQELYISVTETGLFPLGPSVDGEWIKTLSPISIDQGKVWKDIDSAIIMHVGNEGYLFSPEYIVDEVAYDYFLNLFLPGDDMSTQRDAIKAQYDCKNWHGPGIADYRRCFSQLVAHAVFNCNGRDLFNTFHDRAYMMEYAYPAEDLSVHATDLVAEFSNSENETRDIYMDRGVHENIASMWASAIEQHIRKKFQAYLGSFAVHGNPNTLNGVDRLHWPHADGSKDLLSDVLQGKGPLFGIIPPWELIQDKKNGNSSCQFWTKLVDEIVHSKGAYECDYMGSENSSGSYEL